MFEVLKSVILTGGFKLTDIQYKIKKLYALGDIDEAQMEELLQMASGGVSPDAERPETLVLIQSLSERIDGLEARVKALEGGEEPEPFEYPEWEPWDGISNKYQPGAIVAHKGELWESIFNGQNVWEPGAAGTENLWEKFYPEGE
ncbi:MAG: hypothetical protein U0L09_09145 [Christensenellales bacterium]|nr:hypothetical protein [Christensenellales bacterium]